MKSLRCTRDVMDRWEIQKCEIVCGENEGEEESELRYSKVVLVYGERKQVAVLQPTDSK